MVEIAPAFVVEEDHVVLARAFDDPPAAALVGLRGRLAVEPARAAVWAGLGIASARMGLFEEAVEALHSALNLEPGHVVSKAYLGVCLALAGRDDEAKEVFDQEGMIGTSRLLPDASVEELDAFNRELVQHVHSHPSFQWELAGKATKGGGQTKELLGDGAAIIARFTRALQARLSELMNFNGASIDGPAPWRLTAWGVSLRTGGYQEPHIHPAGIVSGVYYAQVPEMRGPRDAGTLRFPRKLPWLAPSRSREGLPAHLLRPEAGQLVIFPSYFWHETVPFEAEGDRVSIAFDVMPADQVHAGTI